MTFGLFLKFHSESISTKEKELLRVMCFKLFCLLPFFLPCCETLREMEVPELSAEDLKDSCVGGRAGFIYI